MAKKKTIKKTPVDNPNNEAFKALISFYQQLSKRVPDGATLYDLQCDLNTWLGYAIQLGQTNGLDCPVADVESNWSCSLEKIA